MRLFSHGCDSWQLPYAAAAGGLSPSERLALEAHAAACPECADALRNVRAVDGAVRRAYGPLRERRVMLAPGRVRLALAHAGPRSVERRTWLRAPAFFGRLAEVSVMLGVTIFVVGGSLAEPSVVPQQPPSVIEEYFRSRPAAEAGDALRRSPRSPLEAEPVDLDTTRTVTPRFV
jgi:anti-sigma factor RsiW